MTGPSPAVAAVRVAVRAALADEPTGALLLVACSGGPDSLALAAAAAFEAPRTGLRAGAVVVDHGLQPGSDEVAGRAAAACRALGMDPVLVRAVRVDGPGGPEAAARDARYAALAAAAAETGAWAVLLGHTRDDQAESVLLGLARGSGARSLAGMPPRRGVFRRPLLGISRAQTLAACAAQGLDPWQDPTNAAGAGAPLRSRVRGELMPVLEEVLGPGVPAALARTADLLREQADALDELAAALLSRAAAPLSLAAALLSRAAAPLSRAAADTPPGAPARSASRIHIASEEVGPLPLGSSDVRTGERVASEEVGPLPLGSSDVTERGREIELDVGVLVEAPVGVRRAALHRAALAAGAAAGSLTREHVLALDALVVHWHGQGPVPLPGRTEGLRRCGRLYLAPAGVGTGPQEGPRGGAPTT